MQRLLSAVTGTLEPLKCGVGVFNRYHAGDYMEMHTDKAYGLNPVVTLIIGLRDDYQGGQLLVFPKGSKHPEIFDMGAGKLVLLSAGLEHQVKVVMDGIRETATLILTRQSCPVVEKIVAAKPSESP